MNRKNWSPADLSKVTTYPLSERTNKVSVQDFAAPINSSLLIDDLLESLPKINQVFITPNSKDLNKERFESCLLQASISFSP